MVRAQNRTRTCTSWNTRTWNERVYHSATWARKSWADNETRTRDPNLGTVVLYQLSYFRKGLSEEQVLLAEMRVQRYAILSNGQKKSVTFLRCWGYFLVESVCRRLSDVWVVDIVGFLCWQFFMFLGRKEKAMILLLMHFGVCSLFMDGRCVRFSWGKSCIVVIALWALQNSTYFL